MFVKLTNSIYYYNIGTFTLSYIPVYYNIFEKRYARTATTYYCSYVLYYFKNTKIIIITYYISLEKPFFRSCTTILCIVLRCTYYYYFSLIHCVVGVYIKRAPGTRDEVLRAVYADGGDRDVKAGWLFVRGAAEAWKICVTARPACRGLHTVYTYPLVAGKAVSVAVFCLPLSPSLAVCIILLFYYRRCTFDGPFL